MTTPPSASPQTIALLVPGQTSQGMGKELSEKYPVPLRTFAEADQALGYKLSQLCFAGPEEKLRMAEITQPAILNASVAAGRVWHEKGVDPSFVVGHSLGEYSAHAAAGTMSFADAVCTVRNRGKYMREAVPGRGRHGGDFGDGRGEGRCGVHGCAHTGEHPKNAAH